MQIGGIGSTVLCSFALFLVQPLNFALLPSLGTGHATKSNEFSEKFQTAIDPPFLETYIANSF